MGLTFRVKVRLLFWLLPGDAGIVIVICHLPTSRGPLAIAGGAVQNALDSKSNVAVRSRRCRLPRVNISQPFLLPLPSEREHPGVEAGRSGVIFNFKEYRH